MCKVSTLCALEGTPRVVYRRKRVCGTWLCLLFFVLFHTKSNTLVLNFNYDRKPYWEGCLCGYIKLFTATPPTQICEGIVFIYSTLVTFLPIIWCTCRQMDFEYGWLRVGVYFHFEAPCYPYILVMI